MTPEQLFSEFVNGFERRKFSAGLLIAFIDFLKHFDTPNAKFTNLDDFLAKYPRQFTTNTGQRANTLIVDTGQGNKISLRPHYNAAERFFRAEHKRFDYPSCAPHATQAWGDYIHWLNALVTYSDAELSTLRQRVSDYVLETLKSQAFDPSKVKVERPLFRIFLEEFELTKQKGEPTGAAYQGVVFGFLRADNPHLQVETRKVRTGSRRLQGVGDIDAWEGARLAISAEVKQYIYKLEGVPDLEGFANEIGLRGALGLVVSLGFEVGVRDALIALGLKPLDLEDLLNVVQLWDPVKQRTAISSLEYYLKHVEMNSNLAGRFDAFLVSVTASLPENESTSTADQED